MVVIIEGPKLNQSLVCESILCALPDWFGIEEANQHYLHEIEKLPTFLAKRGSAVVGFLSLKIHFPQSAEIYVMGVLPEFHRQGIGKMMLLAAEEYLRQQEVEYLQVKTLNDTHPDPNYARTRKFYLSTGFCPVEVLPLLWDQANPCLLLIKRL
jgi:ribosomal protein S18 acetylase RimI-like enzyme